MDERRVTCALLIPASFSPTWYCEVLSVDDIIFNVIQVIIFVLIVAMQIFQIRHRRHTSPLVLCFWARRYGHQSLCLSMFLTKPTAKSPRGKIHQDSFTFQKAKKQILRAVWDDPIPPQFKGTWSLKRPSKARPQFPRSEPSPEHSLVSWWALPSAPFPCTVGCMSFEHWDSFCLVLQSKKRNNLIV